MHSRRPGLARAREHMTNDDKAKIEKRLDQFATGWRKADADMLKGIWDAEYPHGSYIASEKESVLCGYGAIAEYYDEALAMFPITSMKISNVMISEIGDAAHAYCNIAIGFKVNNQEHLVYPRATLVLRKRADQWWVVHYHESIKWELPT